MSKHVVVDGSNLATEGRALPSLKQLNEAIAAYRAEHPDHVLIVVADATFGHRIDPSEVGEFDAMVETGQIVCPPAGAVGRGDAFVLTIADKADALILSNDSFQEFHGTYPWLFDENRLMGGKPVPFIGWVFVYRTPVRGPLSRKSVQVAKRRGRTGQAAAAELAAGRVSKEAMAPMPVPKLPPPRARKVQQSPATPAKGHNETPAATPAKPQSAPAAAAASNGAPQPPRHGPINDLLPFLEFVEKHPVGSTVEAVIESFSSHGAYAMAGPVRVYLPLRLMAEPAPRSAREMVKIGESRTVSVSSFNAGRRGVDVSLLGVVTGVGAAPGTGRSRGSRKRGGKAPADAAALVESAAVGESIATTTAEKATKRGRGRAAAAPAVAPIVATVEAAAAGPSKKAAGSKAPARKIAASKAPASKAPASKAPATKVPASKAESKKAASAKATPTKASATKAPASKAPATKAAPAKASQPKAPASKPPLSKPPVSEPSVTKAGAPKAVDAPVAKKQRGASKQVAAPAAANVVIETTKQTPAKNAPAKQSPAKKSPAKKSAAAKKAPAAAPTVVPPPSVERSSRPRTNPAR